MPKKSFLLRIDEEVHDALKRWADDELRSVNGQIEFLLRRALTERKRLRPARPDPAAEQHSSSGPEE
ncbi:MAG: hypothetical protein MUF01_08915 [Bryobacterales bacterium]|jgi:hypothetical protein|nr:hypothetical protein [Bryobacterales bacterium]